MGSSKRSLLRDLYIEEEELCGFPQRMCFPDRLLHSHDLLWDPHILPGGGHWTVPWFGRDDVSGSTMPNAQRCWDCHNDSSGVPGHLLLCDHCLDLLLPLCHLFIVAQPSLGHM